jgi:hypothetical protein
MKVFKCDSWKKVKSKTSECKKEINPNLGKIVYVQRIAKIKFA